MVLDPFQCLSHQCCMANEESSPSSRKHASLGPQICESRPALSLRQPGIPEQRLSGGVWRRGPASSCTVSPEPAGAPSLLLVVSPNLLKTCTGCYVLEAHAHANGQPLWKHKERAFWLFSTPMGRWAIAGADVKDGGFVKSSGWIYQECCHKGLMPDRSSSHWLLFDGKERTFISDETFVVIAPTGNQEGSILQLLESSCKVVPKSLNPHTSCKPRPVTLQSSFKWCRETMTTLSAQLDPALLPMESIFRRAIFTEKLAGITSKHMHPRSESE